MLLLNKINTPSTPPNRVLSSYQEICHPRLSKLHQGSHGSWSKSRVTVHCQVVPMCFGGPESWDTVLLLMPDTGAKNTTGVFSLLPFPLAVFLK